VEHHPGIDLVRYRPAPRRERERPRVLFVGGRFAEKGGNDLLAALEGEIGRTLDLDLVTPEPIPERPGLRVHRLSQSDPKLLDLQQQADIFCLPTYGDAAPWAVLEAMACGAPVIATRLGGIPDMLADGRAGVLVRHGDPRGLADAVSALLADPARRRDLGAAGRERCEERYDQLRQFPLFVEHLRKTIADWRGRS
jgi:glycosyltransferase involved in cell wall biosynthesis